LKFSNPLKMKGTVVRFYRKRGFGFIKPKAGGKEVLVHWSKLVTDDKWPYIKRGTEVKFKLVEKDENGKRSAKDVTLANGRKIPVYVPKSSDRVSNDDDVYSGVLQFFDYRKGFGMVKPEDSITWEGVTVTPTDALYFSREAIISTGAGKGMVLNLRNRKKVTFKVYKDKKGLGAHELQNEDGNPFEYEERKRKGRKRKRTAKKGNKPTKKAKVVRKTKEELLEERELDEEETIYTGTVKEYRAEKEFGFISIDEDITFNDVTATEKVYVMKEDIVCCSEEVGLKPDTSVMFKIYKDSMGLGACEVQNEDGTPITYEPEEEVDDESVKPKTKTKGGKKTGSRRSTRKR